MFRAKLAMAAAFSLISWLASGVPVLADRAATDINQADQSGIPGPGVVEDASPGWVWTGMSATSNPDFSNGAAHAGGIGASGSITFAGTGVEVYSMTGPSISVDGKAHKMGTLNVSIDGEPSSKMPLGGRDLIYGVSAAKITGLRNGNHVLQVTATGGWIAVDRVVISGEPVAESGQKDKDVIDYTAGFQGATDLRLNGTARIASKALVLTDGSKWQVASVFTTPTISTHSFKSHFVLRFINAEADGVMFCLQPGDPASLGVGGLSMGFKGIPRGFGLKFDIYNNAGEGESCTGIYFNGVDPTVPAIDLAAAGIILRSGHPIDVVVTYDGRLLVVTMTDTMTGSSAKQEYPVDIPAIIGNQAHVGFTASTGDWTGTQIVTSWSVTGKP